MKTLVSMGLVVAAEIITLEGRVRMPLSSPSASDLVQEGRRLSPNDAQRLEERLLRDLHDLSARSRLLSYYYARCPSDPTDVIPARRNHILWTIRHRPDAEVAGMVEGRLTPHGHVSADPEGYRQARELWLQQINLHQRNPEVLRNAGKFFMFHDRQLAETLFKQLHTLHPDEPEWSVQLGYLYALGIMGVTWVEPDGRPTAVDPSTTNGPFVKRAQQALLRSSNATLLGTTGSIFFQYGPTVQMLGQVKRDYRARAKELLMKAQSLEPNHPGRARVLRQLLASEGRGELVESRE